MKMTEEKERILCKDIVRKLRSKFIDQGWITVSDDNVHSALITEDKVEKSMNNYQWDYCREDGFPSIQFHKDGTFDYSRNEDGLEQFAIYRNGYRDNPDYVELAEDFRLFFGMYEKTNTLENKKYFIVDENGNEEDVAIINGIEMRIKVEKMKAYLAARKIDLLIFVDVQRYSKYTFRELGITDMQSVFFDDDYIYNYMHLLEPLNETNRSSVQLMGKCVLRYEKKYFDAISYPFTHKHRYENFKIGYDEQGDELSSTCNESELSNYFHDNNGAPQATSLVFFNKSVLNKYYGNPNIYSVNDGDVECEGVWILNVDNDQRDYVVVILKDLGHLPYTEQLHWKESNIVCPLGASISNTAKERWFNGKFCKATFPDLAFKYLFIKFCEDWETKIGWTLFLPLATDDKYRFKTLHCLTQQKKTGDYEDQILSMTKIIIDSLNEKELFYHIKFSSESVKSRMLDLKIKDKEVRGGITKFELFILSEDKELPDSIKFLHNLQELRSTTVAHRKSERKTNKCDEYFKVLQRTEQEILEDIFIKASEMLNSLRIFL